MRKSFIINFNTYSYHNSLFLFIIFQKYSSLNITELINEVKIIQKEKVI